MAYEFKTKYHIEFSDTDMAGIVHFSNFFRYMEYAEHAFYRSLGVPIYIRKPSGSFIGWLRGHTECDYRFPVYFGDIVEIHLVVKEVKEKTICYGFYFYRLSEDTTCLVAHGKMIAIYAAYDGQEKKVKAIQIPGIIQGLIHPTSEPLPI